MKIKNLAFFGIMAAILGVESSARADTTTIIASQAYVDAKDDLKQNKLGGSGTNGKLVTATDTAGTVTYTDIDSSVTANSDNLITSGAVATAISNGATTVINGLDYADTDATGTGVVKTVTQDNGQIAVTKGAVTSDDIAAGAVTNAKLATDAVKTGNIENGTIKSEDVGEKETNSVVTSANTGYLATVGGVQKGIMYQSVSNTSWNLADSNGSHFNTEANQETQAAQTAAEKKMAEQFVRPDEYVPTVAAVEARVRQAETTAAGNYADKDLSNLNPAGTAVITTAVTTGAAGGTYSNSTSGLSASTIQGAVDELASEKLDKNTAITASGNTNKIVQYDANGLVTAGTDAGALATRDIARYQWDMNNTALYDINTGAVPTSSVCTESNPCVLTYYKKNDHVFTRWTPMDTEDTSANGTVTTDQGASVS